MALWLMHTYAANELGVWKNEQGDQRDAFLIGNIAPDWINFVPDGRQLYRRKSHFRHQETGAFLIDDFINNYYKKETNPLTRQFYKGYGFHIILDEVWGKRVYFKYFGERVVPQSYYDDCLKWDNILITWNDGNKCADFLKHSVNVVKNIEINQSLVEKNALVEIFENAQKFNYGDPGAEKPHIIQQEDIKLVIKESIEAFNSLFN